MTSHAVVDEDLARDSELETAREELEGYPIVKAIAYSEVKPQRIDHRDSKSYPAILLDDNNRQPIARLHFNAGRPNLRVDGGFFAPRSETLMVGSRNQNKLVAGVRVLWPRKAVSCRAAPGELHALAVSRVTRALFREA